MTTYFYLTHKWDTISYNHTAKSGPWSNDNKWVVHIRHISRTKPSPSESLVLFSASACWGRGSYPSTNMQPKPTGPLDYGKNYHLIKKLLDIFFNIAQ